MVAGVKSNRWVLAVCGLFMAANLYLMADRTYWLNLLPVVLILSWALLAAVDHVLLFLAFATPLSINLEELDIGGIGIALPTEPLMVGLTVLFFFKLALERDVVDKAVWKHPITWIILAQLVWAAFCILPSSMPVVSLKYLAARLWFITTMFFMALRLFREPRRIHHFLWSYIAGLAVVVIYTLVIHAQHGFEQEPAHWVMSPFFKDHTSYGAILAFFLPFSFAAIAFPGYSRSARALTFVIFLLLLTGLVFSYTRAAWLSLLASFAVYIILRLRVPFWVLMVLAVVGAGVYVVEREQITIALERNREESSDDLGEHVQSISNISSDASNLERINRWNSALRMWKERPITGWGPGTYMFQYAPFQASEDRTIISTNFGVQGNAHSEYLGPLSEQGVPGMALILALVGLTTWTMFRTYSRMPAGADRRILLAASMGLVTYYLHGALNNFLDLDKAAVPFWAFTALVVHMDLKYPAVRPERSEDGTKATVVG